jgi:hypothetical protein
MMPYVYPSAGALEGKAKVDGGDCVELIRHYTGAPETATWKAGALVLDNKSIAPGTAIATFVNGRYPNKPKGNHAAFFLRHGAPGTGFWVIDQWKEDPTKGKKPVISARPIYVKNAKPNADGSWAGASDDARAFSVVTSVEI